MSKSFKELLQEHNDWINEARIELMKAAAVKDAFTDTIIQELGSDIENLEQDLENEKDLTHKLKGKLDARDELLRELVEALHSVLAEYQCDCADLYPDITFDMQDEVMVANAVIAKAQEVLP